MIHDPVAPRRLQICAFPPSSTRSPEPSFCLIRAVCCVFLLWVALFALSLVASAALPWNFARFSRLRERALVVVEHVSEKLLPTTPKEGPVITHSLLTSTIQRGICASQRICSRCIKHDTNNHGLLYLLPPAT